MTAVGDIVRGDLTTQTSMTADALNVRFMGSAESFAMADVDAFLQRVHTAALDSRLPAVCVDMRELEFMSSSCFKTFVTWIGALQQVQADRQYRIRFLGDRTRPWQRRSLSALACFAIDLITVEGT